MQVEPETTAKRPRGSGSIFQQRNGTVWWIAFSDRGTKHRESSHSTDRSVAEKLLRRRLAEIETTTFIPRSNVRIDELIADVMSEYKEKQQDVDSIEPRWRLHLKPFFTRRKAVDVNTQCVRRYIEQRRTQNAKPATINRELALLKRAFYAALESTPPKVRVVPYFPTLEEKNARVGFLQDADHAKLARECAGKGLWLRTALSVGVTFGWRLGEVLGLRVGQVDLANREIRLEPNTTKNRHGRTAHLTQETYTLLAACCVNKKANDFVLTRSDGSQVKDFRGAWQGAVVRAGLGKFVCRKCGREQPTTEKCRTCRSRRWRFVGLLYHDLRRSAARNLRRLAVGESVIMKIGGWRTRSVFLRYDITEQGDLADAAARIDAKQKSDTSPENPFGQSSGIAPENSTKISAVTDKKMIAPVLPN